MKKYLSLVLFFLISTAGTIYATNDTENCIIDWSTATNHMGEEIYTFPRVFYDGENPSYPLYHEVFYSYESGIAITAEVSDPVFERIYESELLETISIDDIPGEFTFYSQTGTQSNKKVTTLFVNPFYQEFGIIYRLKSFSIETGKAGVSMQSYEPVFDDESVMSKYDWYQFYVEESGMYQLTGEDLQQMGVDITTVNPENIAVFGNGGAMLPELNEEERPADIQQMAVMMEGGEDGTFDADDKIVFYAEGPTVWRYNTRYHRYEHMNHLYSDKAGYFVVILDEPANRIGTVESVTDEPTHIVNSYTRLLVLNEDDKNVIHSGKQWLGQSFTATDNQHTVEFFIPDVDTSQTSFMLTDFVSRSIEDDSYFYVNYNGEEISTSKVKAIQNGDNTTYARSKTTQKNFDNFDAEVLSLDITYEAGNINSLGWIDYIELHASALLRYRGSQYDFRNLPSYGYQRVAQFNLKTFNTDVRIWDITDLQNASTVSFSMVGDTARFTRPSMDLHEYIVFEDDNLMSPLLGEKVENQNLHGATPVDYIIISHKDFLRQAERLGQIHQDHDGLTYMVLTPEEIYQEYSCGVQDITAIRDFIRSMYLRTNSEKPRFVALIGDASYDYKDRISDNTNLVPTFQSEQSFSLSSSWDTDDYYSLMDDDEGDDAYGLLDIGVGRFPVTSLEMAEQMVDKIEYYLTSHIENSNNWKNKIAFIADDGDSNLHISQAESLTQKVDTTFRNVNINKIYYDAYQRVSVSGGYRFPEAKEALINAVEDGAMIINYTGHGGETGWGMEKVLEIPDINGWDNFQNMPVFITATCEFSRYDNPAHTSAGELVFLNPNGGAVSMLTTSRLSFAQINYVLNDRIYDIVLNTKESEKATIGELMVYAKVPHQNSTKNFVILGDPALKLQLPALQVNTDSIKIMGNEGTMSENDTIRGLENFSVAGGIYNNENVLQSDFNGSVNVKVFDKQSVYSTLGQAGDSSPMEFSLLDKVLFDGYADVVNGIFEINVLIPKEINYQYGKGKISYYAIDSTSLQDASGNYEELVIGGYNSEALNDNEGPQIIAYMNNSNFVNGDKTIENPIFIADISDPCGINCIGNSIGHNITGYLDDNVDQIIELNDYFIPTPGVYNSGKVIFPFSHLDEGYHSFTIKAWDMCNNSSTVTIEFIVSSTIGVAISDLRANPNPVDEYTDITLFHNMPGRTLDVKMEIYDVTGRIVCTMESSQYYESTTAGPYRWDRRDYNNRRVGSGAYPYRISIRSNSGEYTVSGGTLILK